MLAIPSSMKNIILNIALVAFLVSCGRPQGKDTGAVEVKKSALIAATLKTWNNNQTLKITFIDGTPEQKAEVEEVSKEWLKYANLYFKFYPSKSDMSWRETPDIVISFKAAGNNSQVGTDSKNMSTYSMSLSAPSKFKEINRHFIIHEFGHAIGLEHEHQHIDRNFDLDEAATLEYCLKEYKLPEISCRIHMLSTVSAKDHYFSKYDPKSIMHYGFHAGFFKSNKVEIPASGTLSLLDKLEIANVYPGRTTKEKIIADHYAEINTAAGIQFYKNCKVVESTIQEMRLNDQNQPELQNIPRYTFSSIRTGEFSYDYLTEDKRIVVRSMQESDYCNYDETALLNYRANSGEKRSQEKAFGNCNIPLDESGSAVRSVCTDEFPFEIKKNGKDELAVNLCFPKFETAVLNMKTIKYCTMDPSELVDIERKKNEEMEKSLVFGKCTVKDASKITNPKERVRCNASTPWFVSITTTFENFGTCYSSLQSAVKDMNSRSACNP